jgi:DnaJ-domain-containing protein 1
MGILDRLENVIKSYLDDEDGRIFGRKSRREGTGDPDLDAAYEELNDYLGKTEKKERAAGNGFSGNREQSWNGGFGAGRGAGRTSGAGGNAVPESLRADFAELGIPSGSSAEECKNAYKKLLKIHHPDRHAGHPGNLKKATERTARINAAYDRIEKWRETGAV